MHGRTTPSRMHRVQQLQSHLCATGPVPSSQRTVTGVDQDANVQPTVVLVTGAVGNIAYAILPQICKGLMLGADTKIELRLLDIPPMADKIKGVMMEIDDGAYPLVTKVVGTTDYETVGSASTLVTFSCVLFCVPC